MLTLFKESGNGNINFTLVNRQSKENYQGQTWALYIDKGVDSQRRENLNMYALNIKNTP